MVTNYVVSSRILNKDQLRIRKEHTSTMEAITSTLSDEEFIDVKDLDSTFAMWEKLKTIYDGYTHV